MWRGKLSLTPSAVVSAGRGGREGLGLKQSSKLHRHDLPSEKKMTQRARFFKCMLWIFFRRQEKGLTGVLVIEGGSGGGGVTTHSRLNHKI